MEQASPQHYRFVWQGIEIEIETIYTPLKWNAIAHLTIRSIHLAGAALPITSTGYLSHFHPPGTVEALGGDVVAQVIAWLDDQAAKPAWAAHIEANRQGELF